MTTEHDAAPAVSDDARRLMGAIDEWDRACRERSGHAYTEAREAKYQAVKEMLVYVAGLEAEVARLRDALDDAEGGRT